MLFALVAFDKPNNPQRRLDLRPRHLTYLDSLGSQLKIAGPFLDEAGNMAGSIVVIEAETEAAAREVFGRDPFMQEGLFDSVTIKPWRLARNNTQG
jgi:uncharacterized protein